MVCAKSGVLNLRNSFPEKTEKERRQIARKFYRFLCDLILENQLYVLDVSTNTALQEVLCRENRLSETALNAFFDTLHANDTPNKILYISGNLGTAVCNRSIATDKGWTFED